MKLSEAISKIYPSQKSTFVGSGVCKVCKKIFYVRARTLVYACSRKCSSVLTGLNCRKGWSSKCANCSNQIWVRPSSSYYNKNKFCSRRCYNSFNVGKNHPSWKGGTSTINGYRVVCIDKKRILQHRYIMEQNLGRPLKKFEQVHHKNGIRSDNRIENLEIWASLQQPYGQRVKDLVEFVVKNYRYDVINSLH